MVTFKKDSTSAVFDSFSEGSVSPPPPSTFFPSQSLIKNKQTEKRKKERKKKKISHGNSCDDDADVSGCVVSVVVTLVSGVSVPEFHTDKVP